MLATLAALVLWAAPVKVAVPGFTVVGMDQALGEAWAEHFLTLLGRDEDFKLITSKDIAQVLGLERQKQLLGCSDDQASCLAELTGALGVDAIFSGTFAQSGTSITATLRIMKATDGSQIAAATRRVNDVDALQDWLEAQAPEFGAKLRTAFKLTPPAAVSAQAPTSGGAPVARWVPAIIGGAAFITGAVLFGLSKDYASRLRGTSLKDDGEIYSAGSTGRTFEGVGVGLMVTGGVAIAGSLAWNLVAPRGEVKVAVVASPFGIAGLIGGSF